MDSGMMESFFKDQNTILYTSVITLILCLLSVFRNSKNQLPLLAKEYRTAEQRRQLYLSSAGQLYKKGLELFKDKPYRLETADG
jgi:hypothetical protein